MEGIFSELVEHRDPQDLKEAVELNERLRELNFPVLPDAEIEAMKQILEDNGWL
jgi:hypothetical protein